MESLPNPLLSTQHTLSKRWLSCLWLLDKRCYFIKHLLVSEEVRSFHAGPPEVSGLCVETKLYHWMRPTPFQAQWLFH